VDLAKLVTNISLTQFLSPIAAVLFMLNSDHAVIPHNLKHGVLIMSMSGLSRILQIKPPMELLSLINLLNMKLNVTVLSPQFKPQPKKLTPSLLLHHSDTTRKSPRDLSTPMMKSALNQLNMKNLLKTNRENLKD